MRKIPYSICPVLLIICRLHAPLISFHDRDGAGVLVWHDELFQLAKKLNSSTIYEGCHLFRLGRRRPCHYSEPAHCAPTSFAPPETERWLSRHVAQSELKKDGMVASPDATPPSTMPRLFVLQKYYNIFCASVQSLALGSSKGQVLPWLSPSPAPLHCLPTWNMAHFPLSSVFLGRLGDRHL